MSWGRWSKGIRNHYQSLHAETVPDVFCLIRAETVRYSFCLTPFALQLVPWKNGLGRQHDMLSVPAVRTAVTAATTT
jgi:hypothetical protein